MSRNKKSLEVKVQEEMPEFVSEVSSLDSEALNLRLSQLAKDIDEVERAQDEDVALEEARKTASELAAPYKDSKKALRLKGKYIISLLKSRGN